MSPRVGALRKAVAQDDGGIHRVACFHHVEVDTIDMCDALSNFRGESHVCVLAAVDELIESSSPHVRPSLLKMVSNAASAASVKPCRLRKL